MVRDNREDKVKFYSVLCSCESPIRVSVRRDSLFFLLHRLIITNFVLSFLRCILRLI